MTARRHVLVLAASATPLVLLGCASTESDVNRRSGPNCYRNARNRPIVCTSKSIPGLDVEAEAKRFDADPGALTIYVVRSGWGDTRHLVAMSADDSRPVETVPHRWSGCDSGLASIKSPTTSSRIMASSRSATPLAK